MSDDLNSPAFDAAAKAVEDALIDLRDLRIGVLRAANGLVVREQDGRESCVVRLTTKDALRIGIRAYLAELAAPDPEDTP